MQLPIAVHLSTFFELGVYHKPLSSFDLVVIRVMLMFYLLLDMAHLYEQAMRLWWRTYLVARAGRSVYITIPWKH